MGLTYFKRYRMELGLEDYQSPSFILPTGYELLPWDESLIKQHALAKFHSFQWELDANVFPCLGRRDGCERLMREITRRSNFTPEATWLLRYRDAETRRAEPVGTVQGICLDGWGALQNLGITKPHRGQGLGSILLSKCASGFRDAGLANMHLEVTTDNSAALRLYERQGFHRAQTVFKAADVEFA